VKITLFGANGKIGRLLLDFAIKNGDEVTAYVRRETTMPKGNNLSIVIGDLANKDSIEGAIRNSEIIISTLGPALDMSRRTKNTPIADGHDLIIEMMKKWNKKRLITLSTPSIHSDDDTLHIATIVPGFMARILFPNPYRDMKKLEMIIKGSQLDWTVVRIINPNVKHNKNDYRVSIGNVAAKMAVSRENVARFMYDVALNGSYIRQMPIVYNK
jgi:putative NADH-flavin reductase